MNKTILKGLRGPNFQKKKSLFLMSRIFNIGIVYASSKFESKKLSYKQDTEFDFLCFVNNAKILLLFIYVLYFNKF